MELNCKDTYDLIITQFPIKSYNIKYNIGFSEMLIKALQDVKCNGYVCSF